MHTISRWSILTLAALLALLAAPFLAPAPAHAAAPTFEITPSTLQFGTVVVGDERWQNVTIQNTSSVQLGFAVGEISPSASGVDFVPEMNEGACMVDAGAVAVVPAEQFCSFLFHYKPTGAKATNASTKVSAYVFQGAAPRSAQSINGLRAAATKTLQIKGTGGSVKYTVNPDDAAFGNVSVDGSKTIPISVTNNTAAALAFDSAMVAPTDGLFAIHREFVGEDQGDCSVQTGSGNRSVVLATGGTCTIQYTFNPTAKGKQTGQARINAWVVPGETPGSLIATSGPPTTSSPLTLTGTGAAPTISVDQTTLSFGQITTGSTATGTVLVKNTSNVKIALGAHITDPEFPPYTYDVNSPSDACQRNADTGVVLVPDQTCRMSFSFYAAQDGNAGTGKVKVDLFSYPNATQGSDVNTVNFTPDASMTLSLKGSGKAPTAAAAPKSVTIPEIMVGQSSQASFTVKNTSSSPISIEPTVAEGGTISVTYDSGECYFYDPYLGQYSARTVAPGSSCVVGLSYFAVAEGNTTAKVVLGLRAATGADGDYKAPSSQFPSTESVTVKASAKGPTVAANPSAPKFPVTPTEGTSIMTVELTNTSNEQVVIDPQLPPGPFAIDYSTGTCVSEDGFGGYYVPRLAPGAPCSLVLTYTASRNGGEAADLQLFTRLSTGPAGSYVYPGGGPGTVTTVKVKGTGKAPTIATTSTTFPSTLLGTTSSMLVTVTNTSNGPITIDPQIPGATFSADFYPGGGDDCRVDDPFVFKTYLQTVAAGGTCNVLVTYQPGAVGAESVVADFRVRGSSGADNAFALRPNSPGVPREVTFKGTATAPTVTLNPKAPAFPVTTVGTTSYLDVVVTNTTSEQITVAPSLGATQVFTIVEGADECTYYDPFFGSKLQRVAPGQTCVVRLAFAPTKAGAAPNADLFLQLRVLRSAGADGAYISPETGPSVTTSVSVKGSGKAAG
ncbi:choice-of-anchor D domain-containing protein [Nocardioides humilatus]|uniref:Choice-of-anchor D domain-containing protein n=1 Tax=Nocardioides humilatus TaxID=2607660 RepID=A0A5B1LFB6_9ACTN|nr:choice-of-anchor D domain-containing protein [Nocardioides humilatus]KAA1419333.1 choice-of-anchor D domain-containing protein [Nocardioides humilatus]